MSWKGLQDYASRKGKLKQPNILIFQNSLSCLPHFVNLIDLIPPLLHVSRAEHCPFE